MPVLKRPASSNGLPSMKRPASHSSIKEVVSQLKGNRNQDKEAAEEVVRDKKKLKKSTKC